MPCQSWLIVAMRGSTIWFNILGDPRPLILLMVPILILIHDEWFQVKCIARHSYSDQCSAWCNKDLRGIQSYQGEFVQNQVGDLSELKICFTDEGFIKSFSCTNIPLLSFQLSWCLMRWRLDCVGPALAWRLCRQIRDTVRLIPSSPWNIYWG